MTSEKTAQNPEYIASDATGAKIELDAKPKKNRLTYPEQHRNPIPSWRWRKRCWSHIER